jgi:FMN phosphatase YigB (HAD superfamily)
MSAHSSECELFKILFLDVGDTILDWSPATQQDAANRITSALGRAFSAADLSQAHQQMWCIRNGARLDHIQSDELEQQYWLGFYTEMLQNMGVQCPPSDLVATLARHRMTPEAFAVFPDTPVLLAAAKRTNLPVGIISNAFVSVLGIFRALHLEGRFDPLVLSFVEEIAKPDAEIYKLALNRAGVEPQQALFVDDRPKFVEAAIELGMRGYLLDRSHQHAAATVPRLHGLLDLLPVIENSSVCQTVA